MPIATIEPTTGHMSHHAVTIGRALHAVWRRVPLQPWWVEELLPRRRRLWSVSVCVLDQAGSSKVRTRKSC